VTQLHPEVNRYAMGESRLIEWRGLEGQTMRGVLLLPPGYQRGKLYPLIVDAYPGEKKSKYLNRYGGNRSASATSNMQLLATRGYAILLPDTEVRKGRWMRDIAECVIAGVDKVIEMGIADPDRLGVMGHSAGGYAVMSLVVQTTRFKAAIVQSGFADFLGHYAFMRRDGSALGLFAESVQFNGNPWERRQEYIENSPIYYLDRVQTPILIVHGSEDVQVPVFLADQIFVALRRLGKEVCYTRYEGEGHGLPIWSAANQVDLLNRRIEWFDRWLKQTPAAVAESNSK
jgi:dipeptidyl aminopeptidase/acylaminoacyl peptidase